MRERERKRQEQGKERKLKRTRTLTLEALDVVLEALAQLEVHASHLALRKPKRQKHAEQSVPTRNIINVLHVLCRSIGIVAGRGSCSPV